MSHTSQKITAIKLFNSYSHKDEELRKELENHLVMLKREGIIESWHDRKIGAGSEWAGEIDEHLNTAHIILLLVSPDFLASDYCYDIEVQRAMERHEAGSALVIPIILRTSDWKRAPFSKLQVLPKDGVPIKKCPDRDEAFLNVAEGIRDAVSRVVAAALSASDNHNQALKNYLLHLCQHQLTYSPLPLVKASTQDRSAAKIKDIFVPISVRGKKTDKQSHQQKVFQQTREMSSPQNNPTLGSLILDEQRVVLLGPPGGGKTTLLKRTALALAERRSEDISGWSESSWAVPIFLRLRSFAAYLQAQGSKFIEACPASIIAYLEHYYREEQRVALPPQFFDELLEEGGCGVFMDGLDEVPAIQREEVSKHVDSFISRYRQAKKVEEKSISDESHIRIRNNIFVLTSRPKGYELAEIYLRDASFAVCEVKPLEPTGIRQLIHNLLSYIEPDEYQRNKDIRGLCEAIFRESDLMVLAGTPLFCTSLVLVYKYRGAELPQRRIDVFEEIVNLLLGFWKAQDQKVVQSGHLDEDDGAGITSYDLGSAVNTKKKRLNHIALQMQRGEKRTEIDFLSLVDILSRYLTEKEGAPPEKSKTYAHRFLVTSHERSGLLVETEPSDPPIYAFTHEGFREYLVADALVNSFLHDKFIDTILENIDNPTWEEILILAGSHTRVNDAVREDLLERCVSAAKTCKAGGNLDGWAKRLTMAGRMARDMGEYLSPKDRVKLKEILAEAMLDTDNQLKHRIEVALVLDDLGWLTDTLFACVPFHVVDQTQFYIGKNLVANQQYQRFLNAPDFGDLALWENSYCVDRNGRPYSLREEAMNWLNANRNDKRLPKSWNDPKFGIAHRGLPIVGVSWYEAAAYCCWLQRHWDELDEARVNPNVRPRCVRLPTEGEWNFAVFGDEKSRRFPWEKALNPVSTNSDDLLAYANIGKSLERTSPVGMFPKGTSHPHGLVDVCGNAWEWQANLFDHSCKGISLRGGAFTTSVEDASIDLRGWRDPIGRDNDLGFRILIEVDNSQETSNKRYHI